MELVKSVDVKEMKKVRIVDFCQQNGIGIKQDSREYYRLEEHDSCVISDKKNLFRWNSQNVGGDVLDFIQAYYNCGFREAKQRLMDKEYENHDYKAKPREEPYEYDKSQESNGTKQARDYLIDRRKIDHKLVDSLLLAGLVQQDQRGNVLFLWKEKNEIVGCTEQGTKTFYNEKKQKQMSWKKIQENSKEYSGFKLDFGKPEKLYFFESEIDMLSYLTQKPQTAHNARFVSMNGMKKGTIIREVSQALKETGLVPKETIICVDNDKPGKKFFNEEFAGQVIGRDGIGISVIKADMPIKEGFDWNDTLTKRKLLYKKLGVPAQVESIRQEKQNLKMEINIGG